MTTYIHYPDLTEYHAYDFHPELPTPERRTEFEFVTKLRGEDTIAENLIAQGFTKINTMWNWWPTHWVNDHRILDFYWRKNKEFEPSKKSYRKVWGGASYPWLRGLIAATGCGFKIGHYPIKREFYFRFFSLLRLDRPPKKWNLTLLKKFNFTKIDEGTQAEYWLNGWPHKEYTDKMELDFWKKHDPKDKLQAKVSTGDIYGI